MMNDEPISVIDAADRIGIGMQAVFKILKRLEIETFRQHSSAHNGQAIAYITSAGFAVLQRDVIARNVGTATDDDDGDGDNLYVDVGVFYLVQLEPEHDAGRFKVGFATNLSERLRSHRCSAPFASEKKTWPCKRRWERTAIDCVTAGCEQLHTEVFRCDDIDSVIVRCDEFFAMMPEFNSDGSVDVSAEA